MSAARPEAAESPASCVYAEYIKAELDLQHERKASLEQRGMAVITSSGALVSLLFALGAVITGAEDFSLPSGARAWLYAAVVLFVAAALGALFTNAPLKYVTVTPDALRASMKEHLGDSEERAHKNVALTRVKVFEDTKRKNDLKGKVLLAAMAAEVLAVGCVAVAVGLVLMEA